MALYKYNLIPDEDLQQLLDDQATVPDLCFGDEPQKPLISGMNNKPL